MTFPPGPPPGRSLPTWHGKKQDDVKSETTKPTTAIQVIKRTIANRFRRRKWTNSGPENEGHTNAPEIISTPSSSTPNEQDGSFFRLLDLPREIRDKIYSLMISDPGIDPCDKFQPPSWKSFETRPLFYNLEYNACMLAASRQTQSEFARTLCIKKRLSAVPDVVIVISEAVRHTARGPYFWKNYLPLPLFATQVEFLAPFVEFLQTVEIRMEYCPLPCRTRWDPQVTLPDSVQINLTEPLIDALKSGKNLQSVRIRLYLSGGKFELGWVSREMERFKAIPGFELVQLDGLKVYHESMSMTHTLWAIPQDDGKEGWKHLEDPINFFYSWSGTHTDGHDVMCFECWREVQREGADMFPGFDQPVESVESFLKLKRLEAPDFTLEDWKNWKPPL